MATFRLQPLEQLIRALSRLPAIGRRSAERIAYRLVQRDDGVLSELLAALTEARDRLCCCRWCGSVTTRDKDPCPICCDRNREPILCIVEDASDIIAFENAGGYHGRYHALGGKLSPMQGTGIKDLRLNLIRKRIQDGRIKEVVIALNTDTESDATAHYLLDMLSDFDIKVTRLALGIPAGSGIQFADSLTLSRAIQGRSNIF
jgi:recombination protein RecR